MHMYGETAMTYEACCNLPTVSRERAWRVHTIMVELDAACRINKGGEKSRDYLSIGILKSWHLHPTTRRRQRQPPHRRAHYV